MVETEMAQAAEASKNGRLTERCQGDGLQGVYASYLKSTNQILDTLVMPVGKALKVLNNVTNGDLTARIMGDYKGDHAIFQNALNLTIKTLDDALHQVGIAAEQVAAAAGQISSGSQTLSRGSSEQAGSIEEVSSSLQEVAAMTKQNAQNAKEASNLSKVAEVSVEAGVESMKRLSEAISRIKQSSDSTAKIIKTIDEIAFQTNILALNAAVEAARAGMQEKVSRWSRRKFGIWLCAAQQPPEIRQP
jgi:methyl-accepting chemotaxis protein